MKLEYMKKVQKSLFILGLSLMTLDANKLSVLAAPAPIFKPVINQIKQRLPNNLVFRLPSSLPNSITQGISKENLKVVLKVNNQNAYISLLNTGEDCQNINTASRLYNLDCRRISINTALLSSDFYKNSQANYKSGISLNLNKSIKASLHKGDAWNNISWIQNGIFFQVYSGSCSENELIKIANSMVNEKPITRTR
jgi:hypothetical protein